MIIDQGLTATLVLHRKGVDTEYHLERVEVGWMSDTNAFFDKISLRGDAVDGAEIPKPDPQKTVADLGIADLHKTRVRIEKNDGIYEGVVHAIGTSYDTLSTWGVSPFRYIDHARLQLGEVGLSVDPSTPITIIKENA